MRATNVLFFGLAVVMLVVCAGAGRGQTGLTEAPSGFDKSTNGLINQQQFEVDLETFNEQESVDEGLGPVFNATSCGECHSNPVTGGISQLTELRAGYYDGSAFYDAPGGSLINDRAINAALQEYVPEDSNVRTFRTSLNTLGDGFIECIADTTLRSIASSQASRTGGRISGQIIMVPVAEANGTQRVGRFGWKNQHASLVSFSADAYLNEMGITSPLQQNENTSMGHPIMPYDKARDPEDNGSDVAAFAEFMRATKAPPRDTRLAQTGDAQAGSALFDQIGCALCHVRDIVTAAPGTVINGGAFTVPPALGNKIIHPFGDFLLHDVGTGDGIVQNGGQSTRNKLRTPPLWGVRTRTRLMHDGNSMTFSDAILRHRGEAEDVINAYRGMTRRQQDQLVTFLKSL
jgi:CxxC motif-containing protein (DUF1111 family)